MFSHITENGIHVSVSLTPANRVIMRLTHLQRTYSLDITHTAWGKTILGVPVDKLRLAEDMAKIGKFWQGVNNHFVIVVNGLYRVSCPLTKDFRSRAAQLTGTREERAAAQIVCCLGCGAEVAIPDHDRRQFVRANTLTVPKWKRRLEEVASHIESPL